MTIPEPEKMYEVMGKVMAVPRIMLQFGIGLFIFYAVLVRFLAFVGWLIPEHEFVKYVATLSILIIISQCMLASAAIELGYMLFTPGPDEAIDPLILGITGSALFALSDNESTLFGSSYFETGVITILFTASLLGLFFLRWKCKKWFPKEMGDKQA